MQNLQNNRPDDEKIIRALMQESRVKAPANLRHRIMRQVESSNAYSTQKTTAKKTSASTLAHLRIAFGLMYLALVLILGGAYFLYGAEALKSPPFISKALCIAFAFSSFWMVTLLDAYLRGRRNRKADR